MSGLVVDTSVWIDFFRGRQVVELEDALRQGLVVLSPIVAAELISGVKAARDRNRLADLCGELPLHETPLAHWIQVGQLRRCCAEKGLTVSTPDAHVAQCALDRDALLLARDDVFRRIAELTPLRVRTGGSTP